MATKGKRKNFYFLIFICTYIVMMVFRLILMKIAGSKGNAYFCAAADVFFFLCFSFSYAFENSVRTLIEIRLNRQMYENMKRVFKGALILGLVISFVLILLFTVFGKGITEKLFRMHLTYMPFVVMLPAIPLTIISGVLRGYISGTGSKRLSDRSYLIFGLIYLITGIICPNLFLKYGTSVSKLLRVENYTYSYSAIGASLCLVIASFFSFIYLLVICIMYSNRTVLGEGRDYAKSFESMPEIFTQIASNGIMHLFVIMSVGLSFIINDILMLSHMDDERVLEFTFGEYYGKSMPLIHILICVLALFMYSYIKKAKRAVFRDEYRNAREKLGRLIHSCSVLGMFLAGMAIVLSTNVLDILYASSGQDTNKYIQAESAMIVLGLFALVMIEMLLMLKSYNIAAIICGIGFVVHTVFALVLELLLKMSIYGSIIANILGSLVIAMLAFVIVARGFQYTQEWFRTFVVSLIGAITTTVIGLLINNTLAPLAGKLISFVVTLVLCLLIYVVILLFLKCYYEEELEESVIGRVVLNLGRTLRLI